MQLKYKKILLLLTMGIMGIGMLTISFDKTSQADTSAVKTSSDQVLTLKEEAQETVTKTVTVSPTIIATAIPTQILEDPLTLKLSDNKKINSLVETYYTAMLETDEETLAATMTDPSIINIEVISKKLEYINDFHNIVCYTKPGIKEGDYVVYVAFDMEIASIDTYAPALDYLYITTIDDNVYIMTGKIDDKIQALRKEYLKSKDVNDLVTSVDEALTKACKSDQDLQEFYDNLTTSIKAKDSKEKAKNSEEDPQD